MSDQKKRFVVFSIIVLCCFSGAYFFLQKKQLSEEPQIVNSEPKKDSLVVVSLLSEFFDLENTDDPTITDKKSFSGKKCSMLSPLREYGFGVNHLLKDFPSYKNLKSISIYFKCLTPEFDTSACYVFAINDKSGKNIYWEGATIRSEKKDKWQDDSIHFSIKPEFLMSDNTLVFYAWNRAKKTIFIDDINIDYSGTASANPTGSIQTSSTNFFYDFETIEGLTAGTETVKETTAHSGKFACELIGGKEYGPIITKKIKDISTSPLKIVSMSAWIYPLTDITTTLLTASVSNSKNESVFWDGKATESNYFPKNKWTKINALFKLPFDKIDPEDVLSVNIWNRGKTDVIVDDLEVVYGDLPERRGSVSTIDDNSIYEKTFVPVRNKPPFNTFYFQKEEINNGNSYFINSDKKDLVADFSPNDNFLIGNFVPDKNGLDEIICIKDGGSIQGLFAYSSETKDFKKLWDNTNSGDSLWNNRNNYYCGDYNSDGKTDVLLVDKKSSEWGIIDFNGKGWVALSKGKGPKKEWLTKKELFSGANSKEIFTSSDVLFSGNYAGDPKEELLKLNTSWRFDLKMITQDNVGYLILGNIDFKGYPSDFNPKYYEFVKIVSGKFISPDKSSLLIMMRNCLDNNFNGTHCTQFESLPDLPNSTQLYSIKSIE